LSLHRNRTWYSVAVVIVIVAGLASRRWPVLPDLLGKYPGDALWAAMVYLGWGIVLPKASPGRIALLASVICVGVECLKLWQTPWLASLQHTTLGHLVFGHVFSWSNFPAYAAGILAAFLLETALRRRLHPSLPD
jgi:hypothetical protein